MPPVKSSPYLSADYSTPISAFEELPSGPEMKTKKPKKIFPGFSATLDRVGHRSKTSNYLSQNVHSKNYCDYLDYGDFNNYRNPNYSNNLNYNDLNDYGNSKDYSNFEKHGNYSSKSYANRSATVSRYYGAGITVADPKRSKSQGKSLASKFYYSTLRTIKGWFRL